MKAIVLTYDKYKIFADHMIYKYQQLWPHNPFIFKIPYQHEDVRIYYETKYGNKVEMVKSPSGIVDTMDTLLAEFDDNDWIYWCMDDRYLISLNLLEVEKTYNFIENNLSNDISGLMFTNAPWGRLPENQYYYKHKIKTSNNQIYLRRKGYRMIWVHQFLKVKVLRTMFDNFRVKMKMAKEMDYILFTLKLPDNQKLYSTNKNFAIFGESTSRGLITVNCYESLKQNNFEIPNNLKLGYKRIIQGNTNMLDDLIYFIKDRIKKIIGIKDKI